MSALKNSIHLNVARAKFSELFCKRDRFNDCVKVTKWDSIQVDYQVREGSNYWSFEFDLDSLDEAKVPTIIRAFYVRDGRLFFWIRNRSNEPDENPCPIISNLTKEEYNQFKRNFLLINEKEDKLKDLKGKSKQKLMRQLERVEEMKEQAKKKEIKEEKPKKKECPL